MKLHGLNNRCRTFEHTRANTHARTHTFRNSHRQRGTSAYIPHPHVANPHSSFIRSTCPSFHPPGLRAYAQLVFRNAWSLIFCNGAARGTRDGGLGVARSVPMCAHTHTHISETENSEHEAPAQSNDGGDGDGVCASLWHVHRHTHTSERIVFPHSYFMVKCECS